MVVAKEETTGTLIGLPFTHDRALFVGHLAAMLCLCNNHIGQNDRGLKTIVTSKRSRINLAIDPNFAGVFRATALAIMVENPFLSVFVKGWPCMPTKSKRPAKSKKVLPCMPHLDALRVYALMSWWKIIDSDSDCVKHTLLASCKDI